MEDYALKAWMVDEDNGRKRLSSEGDLDKIESKNDFENWKSGLNNYILLFDIIFFKF